MTLYIFEGCQVCGTIRYRLATVKDLQRQCDGLDKPNKIGGADVFLGICPKCEAEEEDNAG